MIGEYKSLPELGRDCKESWMRTEDGPDMPPFAIAERAGVPLAFIGIVGDREAIMRQVAMIKSTAAADRIILVIDTFAANEDEIQPTADLQDLFQAGNTSVTESITVLSATATDIDHWRLPYTRNGNDIHWGKPQHSPEIDGYVPDILRRIMGLPATIDADPLFRTIGEAFGFDRERQLWHATRAMFTIMEINGCLVHDLITYRHPEWLEEPTTSRKGDH